jgi:3-oxoacyl-[acyl-carrier protein] reductase
MSVLLHNRSVLVTGATHGIGHGVAEYFARAGARIVFSGRDETAGKELEDRLQASGTEATFVPADLADDAAPRRLVAAAIDRLGGLDGIVNAAGIFPDSTIADMTLDLWNHVLRVNLTTSMLMLQSALPQLTESGTGRFVAISSITGPRTGFGSLAHYGASKAGLEGFIRSAAVELAPLAITVNAVAPGSILTPGLTRFMTDDDMGLLQSRIPVGHVGQPADIAATAAFLTSADASFITGQSIIVDGGQTLPEIQ